MQDSPRLLPDASDARQCLRTFLASHKILGWSTIAEQQKTSSHQQHAIAFGNYPEEHAKETCLPVVTYGKVALLCRTSSCPSKTNRQRHRTTVASLRRSRCLRFAWIELSSAIDSLSLNPKSHRFALSFIGLTTRNKKLLGAPGIATRSKDATRGSWPC